MDILKHPNVALTTDGKGEAFVHGGTPLVKAEVEIMSFIPVEEKDETEKVYAEPSGYELFSEEDIEKEMITSEENSEK